MLHRIQNIIPVDARRSARGMYGIAKIPDSYDNHQSHLNERASQRQQLPPLLPRRPAETHVDRTSARHSGYKHHRQATINDDHHARNQARPATGSYRKILKKG